MVTPLFGQAGLAVSGTAERAKQTQLLGRHRTALVLGWANPDRIDQRRGRDADCVTQRNQVLPSYCRSVGNRA